MTQEEFIAQIQTSPISAARKQQILALITEKGFDFDVKEQIKNIVQEDIDADTDALLTPEDQEKIAIETDQLVKDLSQVEQDLAEDIEFVQTEMTDLDATVKQVGTITDQAQIDRIKSELPS